MAGLGLRILGSAEEQRDVLIYTLERDSPGGGTLLSRPSLPDTCTISLLRDGLDTTEPLPCDSSPMSLPMAGGQGGDGQGTFAMPSTLRF